MVEEGTSPNPIYIVPEILEEIFNRLPSKSILRFRTVCKEWRSILESRSFVERRMKVKKKRKILVAYNCNCGDRPSLLPKSRSKGDEEIVYLHCKDGRPARSCDGLVCILEPDWIIVLNPSTGQLLRFPSDPDPMSSQYRNRAGADFFLGNWAMGFGKDKVTGSYKVVKMCVEPREEGCDVLDVESGEWRNLKRPPYVRSVGRESVCVNGLIYWLSMTLLDSGIGYKVLALDLHKEAFHIVSVPATLVSRMTQVVNLEGRLAIANAERVGSDRILEIWSMNAEEEIWSKTYSILLNKRQLSSGYMWFRPLSLSKHGNLTFYNNFNMLFKYYSDTCEIRCLSSDICVISLYQENLAPLRSESGHYPDLEIRTCRSRLVPKHTELFSRIFKFLKRSGSRMPEIVFTTLVIALYQNLT